jgi:hypothetical protein
MDGISCSSRSMRRGTGTIPSAKDEEVIVEIAGIGPGPTILAKPGERVFFSTKK